MTTGQIVIFIALGIVAITGYLGMAYSKSEYAKALFAFLLLFATGVFALLAIIVTQENNKNMEKLKSKCPEYEKVESVYKLKD